MTSAAAIVSAIPCTAVTTLRQSRRGSGARIQANTHPAAKNTYRAPPIASTHAPTEGATSTLSARIRKASTSPSSFAPNADAVPVRRATCPSTKSRASATDASAVSVATGTSRAKESAVSAATPIASVARASVTAPAGPSLAAGSRRRARASAANRIRADAIPTTQPALPRPTVTARAARSSSCAASPASGPRAARSIAPHPNIRRQVRWASCVGLRRGHEAGRARSIRQGAAASA